MSKTTFPHSALALAGLACVCLASCFEEPPPLPNAYGYVFHESTGIPSHVLVHGKEVAVRFAPTSDPVALTALMALDWPVLYPNADGTHIFVEGFLDGKVQSTEAAPDRATPEPFQELRLVNWYIVTPFERLDGSDAGPSPGSKTSRSKLEAKDFRMPIGGSDLSRYQRKKAP